MTPEKFLTHYKSVLACQDWNKVSSLIHEDVCVVFSIGTHKGKAEVRKAFEKNFSLIKGEIFSISNVHWIQKKNDYAAFLFNFH
ncbi:MAG: nuclear transport factor 2 family protein [Candidatus Marinimicrobia bacterium]|nr:nuclear transport factor 2 family protein [Candidatus Neomarinimicrobiota bacterium]